MNIPWIPIVVVAGIAMVIAGVIYLVMESGEEGGLSNEEAQRVECALNEAGVCEDPSPDLPGEWVNLPDAFKEGDTLAHYGATGDEPNTNAHVSREVAYEETGLPPAGGPHWGNGQCPTDPSEAPSFCGPVPWGAYREEWSAPSLVHNMEHGGVIVWYNSDDVTLRDNLEDWVADLGRDGAYVVLTPYSDIPEDTVAMTAWARREIIPASEATEERVKDFIRELNCHFNPEEFPCGGMN
jgi:hypothetical protein